MFTRFKLALLEAKIQVYGLLHKYYHCKVMRHPYYGNRMYKCNDKIRELETKYGELTSKEII